MARRDDVPRALDDEAGVSSAEGGRPRRRWRPIIGLGVLLAVALVAAVVGSRRTLSPADLAAAAQPPPPSTITAAVERRALEAKVVTRATVSSARTIDLDCLPTASTAATGGASSSKAVFTRRPLVPGTNVAEGEVLAEVNGRPVLALQGDSPAFRELAPSSRGPDVAQLQAALARLGFEPGEHDGALGPGTQRALSELYRSKGYAPVGPTRDEAESLRSARTAVDQAAAAQRQAQAALTVASRPASRVDVLQAQAALAQAQQQALDAARTGGDARGANLQVLQAQAALDTLVAPPDVTVPAAALDDANRSLLDAQAQLAELEAVTGVKAALCELVFVPTLPAVVDRLPSATGGQKAGAGTEAGAASDTGTAGEASTAWMRLSAGAVILQGTVNQTDQQVLRVGQPVSFGGPGSVVAGAGTISAIDPAARGANGTWKLTVTPDVALPGAALGENVRVAVAVRSTEGAVLVVPLAAVSGDADGSAHVTKVGPGGEVRVAVEPGLSADGFVAVVPRDAPSLDAGDRVVVGR